MVLIFPRDNYRRGEEERREEERREEKRRGEETGRGEERRRGEERCSKNAQIFLVRAFGARNVFIDDFLERRTQKTSVRESFHLTVFSNSTVPQEPSLLRAKTGSFWVHSQTLSLYM